MAMPMRVRMARDRASSIIERDGIRVVLGTKSLFDSTPFKIDTFISKYEDQHSLEGILRASINDARDRKAGAL